MSAAAAVRKVAVIGGGSVGSTLAINIARSSLFEVSVGARDPAKTIGKIGDKFTSAGVDISVAHVKDAVAAASVVVVATPGSHDDAGIQALAESLGDCSGKVVIDCTNPLSNFPALSVRWNGKSGGEVLAESLAGAAVYKSFNTVGVEHMADPSGAVSGGAGQEDMLVAGDERDEFKSVALSIVEAVGFKPRYVGPIRYARNLEAIAELWIHLAVPPAGDTKEDWGRNFNFALHGI